MRNDIRILSVPLVAALALAATALAPATTALASPQLLDAEQAFRFSAAADGDSVVLHWRIADDYYMYRERFAVEVSGAAHGAPRYPKGVQLHDPQFGEVEVYYKQAEVRVPITRNDATAPLLLRLKVTGQGCNEPVGVCYPPLTREAQVVLAAVTDGGGSPGLLQSLENIPGGDRQFLPVEEAFQGTLAAGAAGELQVGFRIAPGYYLYRDKITLQPLEEEVTLAPFTLPPGEAKADPYFGDTDIYKQDFGFAVRVASAPAGVRDALFELSWQGCAEDGICYLPVKSRLSVAISDSASGGAAISTGLINNSAGALSWVWLLYAFGAGLLLTFTPCVLPMIPILSGIIVGPGSGGAKPRAGQMHGGMLSVVYVLGTAVTYAAAGALAGATGEQLQAYVQHPAFTLVAALFLGTMALAMFGVFHLQTPGALQTRIQNWGTTRGGKTGMVFVLGMVSALLIGACVSPVLFSVLGAALASASPLFGALTMFSMALGMGAVLIAIGFGLGALAPRAGPWLKTMQQVFGIGLLMVAIYLLGAIPEIPVQVLWGLLLLMLAVFAARGQWLPRPGGVIAGRGIGLFLLVWGVIAVIGGFAGNRDPLHPLGVFLDNTRYSQAATPATEYTTRVANVEEFERVLATANAARRGVVLSYYADWCLDCVRFHETTLRDPRVRELLAERFTFVEVDVGDPLDAGGRALRRRFNVFGPPATVLLDAQGRIVQRFYGYRDARQFLEILRSSTPG